MTKNANLLLKFNIQISCTNIKRQLCDQCKGLGCAEHLKELLILTLHPNKVMKIPVCGTSEFKTLFQSLNKTEPLFKEIDVILETLTENPRLGELIRFEMIPKSLRRKYPDLNNLLRVKVNKNWRLLYTLVGWTQNKTVYVLMAMSHKKYDRLFSY